MHGVYLESVNEDYIESFKIDTTNDGLVKIDAKTSANLIEYQVLFNGEVVLRGESNSPSFSFKIDNPKLWDVDNPNLYDLVLETSEALYSYFGFRSISIEKQRETISV